MKRIFAFVLALVITLSLSTGSAWAANNEKKELVEIDGNKITVRDDGTGESNNGNGLDKDVVLTNRNIGYKGSCGPFEYEVQSMQIAKLKATSKDVASMLGLEVNQVATLVAIQLSVENTSNEDMSWYPDQSTIVTSGKEQVDSNWALSDSVGGQFYGNVVKEGQIFWICKKTDADSLSHFQWRIDSPADSNYNHPWDDVKIEFEIVK